MNLGENIKKKKDHHQVDGGGLCCNPRVSIRNKRKWEASLNYLDDDDDDDYDYDGDDKGYDDDGD